MTCLKTLVAAAMLVLIATTSFADSPTLPAPPQGYQWQECVGAGLTILKPDGWYFREQAQREQGGTYGCAISKENIAQTGPFQTGLMVNYMIGIARKTGLAPSKFAAMWIEALSQSQMVIQTEPASMMQVPDYGSLRVTRCRVRAKVNGDEIIQQYVLVADDRGGHLHLMYFESPADEWEDAWKFGKSMLDTLHFRLPVSNKAIEELTERLRLNPNDAVAYYNRGNAWGSAGQLDKAIADYTEAIRLDPKFAEAYRNRGATSYSRKDDKKAVADLTECIRLDHASPLVYNIRALSWQRLGDNEKAVADYSEAIRLDPEFAPAYENRGNLLAEQGAIDQALADFDAAIRFDPKATFAYNSRGHAWRSKGEYARAIVDYTQVVQLNPNFAPAFNNRAVSQLQIGEPKKALADFNEAIRLDPTFAPAYRDRGAYWARAGKNAEAISDFDEAIRCDPADPMAHFNRGTYWTRQKRFEQAIADFTEAIRLNPRLDRAYGNLAWLQATCEDARYRNGHEAVRLAQRACELTGWSDAAFLDILAAAYAELGDFPNAVKWQNKAIAIDADDKMRTRLSLYEAGEPFRVIHQE